LQFKFGLDISTFPIHAILGKITGILLTVLLDNFQNGTTLRTNGEKAQRVVPRDVPHRSLVRASPTLAVTAGCIFIFC